MDDVEAIKQVKARYSRAADTGDWDLLRTTVTDDFLCETGAQGNGTTTGIDAFIERAQRIPAGAVHHALLPEIELTSPTTAIGIWAVHVFASRADGGTVDGFGHYHDTYEKLDGSWRLRSLRLDWLHREMRGGMG